MKRFVVMHPSLELALVHSLVRELSLVLVDVSEMLP